MKKLLIITLSFLSIIGYSQSFDVKEITLENGLKVYLHEDHSKPEIFGVVITRVGGKNDPADATGLAHYMEHMMFKGTQNIGTTNWEAEKPFIDSIFTSYDELAQTTDEDERVNIQKKINDLSVKAGSYAIPNEISKMIKQMGGTNLNAGTGPDVTLYYNAFPSNQVERWLELYSERFTNPVFRSFQAELEVVYEEKNMYSDNFASNMIQEVSKSLFKNHPYGQQPLIGTKDHLKNPSLTKMKEFYDTYYVANNMALILSGDFSKEDILPIIEEKFGAWKSGELPETKVWEEEPFVGREFLKKRLSPIKIGIFGFRTAPAGHADELKLQLANSLLTNGNQTGLFDELMTDSKLLAAMAMQMPYNDHGATIMFTVPKLVGQKLEEAEGLIISQLDKLKNGEFEAWKIEAAKLEVYKSQKLQAESNQNKALFIANSFGRRMDLDVAFNQMELLNKITEKDIIEVANKYYGENYLAFYSKFGFSKKDKIEKPGYEPIKGDSEAISSFASNYENIPTSTPNISYLDFNNSLNAVEINNSAKLYYTENTKNDIFDLEIVIGVGNLQIPMLEHASSMMNQAVTDNMDLKEIKNEFGKIGCNYSFFSNNSELIISLSGVEKNLSAALSLLDEIIQNPVITEDKMSMLVEEHKTNRKMERSEPAAVADALKDYVIYGQKSSYIDRLSKKEIKNLQPQTLIDAFNEAKEYACEIHFIGQTTKDEIANILKKQLTIKTDAKKFQGPQIKDRNSAKENTIYFVHKKRATQAQIWFLAETDEITNAEKPIMNAFNQYFGGGFSGIVLQEIREYRSMAYSAGAGFKTMPIPGQSSYFGGFIGTQADKTVEAINIFMGLVREMPEKSERISYIKPYLVNSILSSRPGMRNTSSKIRDWQWSGLNMDPAKSNLESYKNLKFEDITGFYENNLKNKPMVICIVGNKKSIDLEALEQYGTVKIIKEKELYTK